MSNAVHMPPKRTGRLVYAYLTRTQANLGMPRGSGPPGRSTTAFNWGLTIMGLLHPLALIHFLRAAKSASRERDRQ